MSDNNDSITVAERIHPIVWSCIVSKSILYECSCLSTASLPERHPWQQKAFSPLLKVKFPPLFALVLPVHCFLLHVYMPLGQHPGPSLHLSYAGPHLEAHNRNECNFPSQVS